MTKTSERPQYESFGHTELASMCHHKDARIAELEDLLSAEREVTFNIEIRSSVDVALHVLKVMANHKNGIR